ncbi:MAG TPA: pitrilysin family protein [Bryobacteraceae bacterium]|nr:pitrilysin family protein [Bryobacteraceae bacterium]
MKTSVKLAIPALLALAACRLGAAQAPQKIIPYPYVQEDLPNGLRLVTVTTDFPNIVAVYIVVQTGSRNEVEPGHTGFAHLFEHLMFRGTEKFPAAQYNETLARIGAASNAFTTDDYTCYYTVFSKEDLPTVLEMEADRFRNLKYAEPEFKTEALAVLGEYNKNSSSPFSKLDETLRDTAFTTSTYKHTTMGFLKDVQDMPNQYEYSLKFFDRYYRPEYTTILVVGDARSKAVRQLADKYWGDWKRGSYRPEIPSEPPQDAPRTVHVDWPGPTLPIVTIAFKSPAYNDANRECAALDALAYLAFSPASDLYQKLVVEEQKADAIFGGAEDHVDASLFQITARVKKPGDMDYVRDQILAAIRVFQDRPVDVARLQAVKKHLRYSAALRMNASDAIAGSLASYVALKRTPETMDRIYEQYAQLTPDDVMKAAAKYLVESSRTIVTLTAGGAQ